jgi:mono/diheme cytochrome c family protein
MKKILFRVLAAGAITVASGAVAGLTTLYFKKPAMAPPAAVTIQADTARLARGKYLFELADCDGCHSQRDFSRFGGPVIDSCRGQGFIFPRELGLPGVIVASNITSDPETGIGGWTDGEIIRAIREGISRDGSYLFPMMPYEQLRRMSDDDVYSLVAFLKTLPPVKHRVPKSQVNFPVSLLVKGAPQPAGSVPPPDRSNPVQYGEYLVTMANCVACHTPAKSGQPIDGMTFAGGEKFSFPGATVVSANITPDAETGIGRWSEQDFLDRFTAYKEYAEHGSPSVGPESFTLMPWVTFSQLPEQDLKAIYAYLRTQKPVLHIVDSHPGIEGPRQKFAGSFLKRLTPQL